MPITLATPLYLQTNHTTHHFEKNELS